MTDITQPEPFVFGVFDDKAECPYCGRGTAGLDGLGLEDGETRVVECAACHAMFEIIAKTVFCYGSRTMGGE